MATRKTPEAGKGRVSAKKAATKKKDPPLTQQARNERWLAKLTDRASKGLPVPRRMNLILSPEAYDALEAIREAHGGTKTDVIATLLVDRAKKLKR